MGCASSRTESRNVDLDDYNTLDVAFVGGDGRPMDDEVCPVDKIFLNYSIERSNLARKARSATGTPKSRRNA